MREPLLQAIEAMHEASLTGIEPDVHSWSPKLRRSAAPPLRRGEIYWLSLPRPGSIDRPHPHVVVQDDVFNDSRIDTVVVCALTTNLRRANEPGNVLLNEGEGGLPKRSVVVVSQISSVAKTSLSDRIGALSSERVDQILAGLRFQQRSR